MTEKNQQNSLLGKIAAYTEILSKDPESTIFVSLSEAYRKMGMLDDARNVVEKGLKGHSDFSPAHIVLGRILCQQGEYADSESAFQKALEYDAESLAALVGFARLTILLGKENEGRELLLRARELSPADPVINKLLLSLPEKKSEEFVPDEAVTAEDAVQEIEEEPATEAALEVEEEPVEDDASEELVSNLASPTLAELYLKQGLAQQALDVYRQLSNDDPDNFQFRLKIRDLEDKLISGPVSEDVDIVEPEATESEEVVTATESSEPSIDDPDEPSDLSLGSEELASVDSVVTDDFQENADDAVIVTLNRWLDSIQRRRENV